MAAILSAAPVIVATLALPGFITTSEIVDLLGPIADARAFAAGDGDFLRASSPFYLAVLFAADSVFVTPGRILLGAKAFSALIAITAVIAFACVRFPFAQTALLAASTAAFVAAPFSGAGETALALLAVAAMAFVCAPAQASKARAFSEGVLGGGLLVALWMSSAALALIGAVALTACPFIGGRTGLIRYAAGILVAGGLIASFEVLSPGTMAARAETLSPIAISFSEIWSAVSSFKCLSIALGAGLVLVLAAIFGGEGYRRNVWTALAFLLIGSAAAMIVGANASLVFVFSAAIATFSTASPFYDGIFRTPDRASVAVGGVAGIITLSLGAAICLQFAEQFIFQGRAASSAPREISAAFAIVQVPRTASALRIDDEQMFETASAPNISQKENGQAWILFDAAARVRALEAAGVKVAILADSDIACVIAAKPKCSSDGRTAAARANIVFVPRIDFGAASAALKGRSEALLYTEFRKVDETTDWDIWVRRGVTLPSTFALQF
ncbi:MAG: hypothetical protein U5J99_00620 [Parvularculaceae bacterium]|nr:hypothetical protein [Parvularculaceae bacterium]